MATNKFEIPPKYILETFICRFAWWGNDKDEFKEAVLSKIAHLKGESETLRFVEYDPEAHNPKNTSVLLEDVQIFSYQAEDLKTKYKVTLNRRGKPEKYNFGTTGYGLPHFASLSYDEFESAFYQLWHVRVS